MSADLDWGSDEIPTVILTKGLRFLRVRFHDLTQFLNSSTQALSLTLDGDSRPPESMPG